MNEFLEKLLAGVDLSANEAKALLRAMMDESAEPAQIGASLALLRAKGENGEEIRGFAQAMLAEAVDVPMNVDGAVDIVGTGGDGSGSVNLSTGAALLTAACGVPVVKHGNRAVSGRSGSADVLEALGCHILHMAEEARAVLRTTGFAFLFAPLYHPALGALRTIRCALGIRTIFNVLGPLINPARPPFAVIGAPTHELAHRMAQALAGMHFERVFVVHGARDWDEPTPMGPFTLLDVFNGRVTSAVRDPADCGISRCSPDELRGGDSAQNARRLRDVFAGERGAHCDALALGAALALEITGSASSFETGLAIAYATLENGKAANFLEHITSKEGALRNE